MKKIHWVAHPIAALFPPMTSEERAEFYQDQTLDGRNRDELWCELALENACEGYFAKNKPPTEVFTPPKHGTLAAWMRAKSLNMVKRQLSADQHAAVFLKAVETFPELKAVVDKIASENKRRKKEGKPLDAGVQRGNTATEIAKLAGVGPTAVKQAKRLKREAPDKFDEVVRGKTSAKKALQEVKEKKKRASATKNRKPPTTPNRPTATLSCTVAMDLLPADGKAAKEVADALSTGKAELRFTGLSVWIASVKSVDLNPGTPLPEGCLADVTGLRVKEVK